MNQPRCVLLAALALAALLVVPVTAQTIDVSLNLRYDDPNTEASGGGWTLVAKVDSAHGLAALRALILDIDHATGIVFNQDIGAIDPVHTNNGDVPAVMYRSDLNNQIELLYGQDYVADVIGVGTMAISEAHGRLATDPLHNSAWDNATWLITGTFDGATRPEFTTIMDGAVQNSTDGHIFADAAGSGVVDHTTVTVTTTDRGDSVATDGLALGDANRDWSVTIADFAVLQNHYNQAGGWDDGDFNSTGDVTIADFAALQNNYNTTQTPPSAVVSGVPEPSTAVLLGLCLVVAALIRRRCG